MIRQIGKAALDTLFPIECLGCRKEGEWLCQGCAGKIPLLINQVCFLCKQAASGGRTCFSCLREFPLAYVIRFFDYDEPLIKQGIHTAKYNYVRQMFKRFAELVTAHLRFKFDALDIDPRALLFIPLPLHPRRLRERGFNQAEIIARLFADELGGKYLPALTRRRATLPQVGLDESDRKRNIRGAFGCADRAPLAGQYAVIVDDVATSGSTLVAAAQALQDAGVKEVGGLVLAKG